MHILTRLGCKTVAFVSEWNRSSPRTSCFVANRDERVCDTIVYLCNRAVREFSSLLRTFVIVANQRPPAFAQQVFVAEILLNRFPYGEIYRTYCTKDLKRHSRITPRFIFALPFNVSRQSVQISLTIPKYHNLKPSIASISRVSRSYTFFSGNLSSLETMRKRETTTKKYRKS